MWKTECFDSKFALVKLKTMSCGSIMLKFSSVPTHVLNIRVHFERVNLPISGGPLDWCNEARRGVYKDAPNYFLGWYRIGIAAKFVKKVIEKEEKKQNGKSTGTGYLSWYGPYSRYNTLSTKPRGTCCAWKENLKIIFSKWNTYCQEQVHKDCVKNWVFWL